MLQQENRLKRKRDIEITFSEGRFIAGNLLNLKIWKVDPLKYPKRKYIGDELQFAFVVGVKIDKRAVVRNRLKRQMREVVRLLLKDKKIQPGFFVMCMAKKEMIDQEYSVISQDLTAALRRSHLFLS
jgi:ribonuclease P protein component